MSSTSGARATGFARNARPVCLRRSNTWEQGRRRPATTIGTDKTAEQQQGGSTVTCYNRARSNSSLTHYPFDDKLGRPGKGDEQGTVKGLVGSPQSEAVAWATEEALQHRGGAAIPGGRSTCRARIALDRIGTNRI